MKSPFAKYMGINIEGQRDGTSRCTLSVEECHINSTGVVHGGVLFSLADSGMGAALNPTLGHGEICATIEIKINYFKPVMGGLIVCTSELVNKGKNVANLDACVYADGILVAKANGSFSIFKRKKEAAA